MRFPNMSSAFGAAPPNARGDGCAEAQSGSSQMLFNQSEPTPGKLLWSVDSFLHITSKFTYWPFVHPSSEKEY
jgi:hypothetical protein